MDSHSSALVTRGECKAAGYERRTYIPCGNGKSQALFRSPRRVSAASGSGAAWRGLPDGRVAAIDVLNAASFELGRLPTSRLVDYCVNGLTTAEIARKHGQKERDMAPVLHQDLRACAIHFLYL